MRYSRLEQDINTLQEFSLCESCLGRMLARGNRHIAARTLGRRMGAGVHDTRCFICKDMMMHLDSVSDVVLQRISEYDFESFSLGAIMKPSILDRDDYIRSKICARGSDSVKTALTRDLSRIVSRTGARPDRVNPDITVVLDTRYSSCEIRSRHMMVRARYTKSRRGLPQKGECKTCRGYGCDACADSSIEAMFTAFLMDIVGGSGIRFTWVGGEDSASLVGGSGRPVYARICNPVRRNATMPETASYPGVAFSNISVTDTVPLQIPKFHSIIRMRVESECVVDSNVLKSLRGLRGIVSVSDASRKPAPRTVHSLRYRRISDNGFQMIIDADGGLPVRRFVSGLDVTPSVSEVLDMPCRCNSFDFLDVTEQNRQPDNC